MRSSPSSSLCHSPQRKASRSHSKRESAHLAVGDDREACLLLELEGVVDRLVLDPLERGGRQLTLRELLLRCEQVGRAKETPDDVRSRVEHALTLRTSGRIAEEAYGWTFSREDSGQPAQAASGGG
jgi:hypothetical protein